LQAVAFEDTLHRQDNGTRLADLFIGEAHLLGADQCRLDEVVVFQDQYGCQDGQRPLAVRQSLAGESGIGVPRALCI
jgi:hypothetical protein